MGQKTGTSNTEKKVIAKATQKAFVMEYLGKMNFSQLSSQSPPQTGENSSETKYK